MSSINDDGIDCAQDPKKIIRDHQDFISISLSRIEREFNYER